MHLFPPARRHPATRPVGRPARRTPVVVSALIAGAVFASVGTGQTAAARDPLKDEQRDVKQQLAHAKDDLHESSARAVRTAKALEAAQTQLASARDALEAAQARREAARLRDQLMQRKLVAAQDRLRRARLELAAGQAAVEQQRSSVASMISAIYQQGDPELLAFSAILDTETPADLTRQMEARNAIVGSETRAYDKLRAAEVLLDLRADEVREAKEETAERRRQAARRLEARQAAERRAVAAKAAVQASVVESQRARAAARRARAADLRKIKQLEAEQRRIEQLLAARAHGSAPTGPSDGFLSYPVNGSVTSSFGYRIHPIYGYWGLHDGTDFGAGCGSPLYASADGRVLSAYWSDGYGNRLILDHGVVRGVGLASIYNHATSYTVGVGSRVKRGQVIGYVGSTGWSTGCHLHFTVMVNGKAVDPMNWL